MSIVLDGFEVFLQVGKHVDLFAPIRADVNKQARALLTKCLKAKAVDLSALHRIRQALGASQFGLLLDGMKDTEVKSMLVRLDKHHPDLKGSTGGWRREHLSALADGSSKPHLPAPKTRKTSSTKKKTGTERLHSEVVDVYRTNKKGG